MTDTFQNIDEVMDVSRTNDLFDSSIKRSGANSDEKYSEADLKQMRTIIGFGNLHINTAKVKLGVARLRGYRDNVSKMKQSIDRKIRNKNKYGRNTE